MRTFVALSVVAAAGALAPATAHAHFTLDQLDDQKPVSWISQDSVGGPQKTGPCSATVSSADTGTATPTHLVTGLMAGETVKITVTATIAHPGWYRVALMQGPSASQSLTTIPDPMAMSGTNCTPAIMTNPVWSKTQPVIADGLPAGSTANTSQSGTKVLTATIPQTANCTAASPCTIQVIMVMTDHPANDCYYHHCADITTDGSPSTDGGMSNPSDASVDARDGGMSMGGGTAAGGAKGSGGAVGTGSGGVTASGGAPASGGSSASGGATASSTGGTSSSGGTSSPGGATSSGGTSASGGKTGSGGTTASGGKTGSGGNVGSGGSSSSSGGATASSGGSSGQGGSSSSSGCSTVPGAGSAPLLAAGASLLALLVTRMRRNRRR